MPAFIDEPPAVKAEDCLDFVPDGPQPAIQFVRSSLETRRVFAKLSELLGRDDIPRVFPGTQPSLFDKEAVQKVCPVADRGLGGVGQRQPPVLCILGQNRAVRGAGFRTALRGSPQGLPTTDHQPPTANRQPLPTAANVLACIPLGWQSHIAALVVRSGGLA